MRRFHLLACTILLGSALALQACLPDDKDPAGVNAGQQSGAYYATSLNTMALKIQAAILNNPAWVTSTTGDSNLDLAVLGITQPEGLSSEVKSGVCPNNASKGVKQITWLDGRGDDRQFALKSIGSGVKDLMVALRGHLGGDQFGLYKGYSTVTMADGSDFVIPASCSTIDIPLGAPVIVFSIDKPIEPNVQFSRMEYRTVKCPSGHTGTKVDKRTIIYRTDGSISPTDPNLGWETEHMGNCIETVDITIENRSDLTKAGVDRLANLAAVSLRDLLADQLTMGCTKLTVRKNGVRDPEEFNNCVQDSVEGRAALSDSHAGDNADTRQIACSGTVADATATFNNIPVANAQMTWQIRDGFTNLITLIRESASQSLNDGQSSNQNDRNRWVGSTINCAAIETGDIACENMPGAPSLEQQSNQKYVNGQLNPLYFTGATIIENGGVVLKRNMSATDWIDKIALTPKIDPEAWIVQSAQCAWNKRDMLGDCPSSYDTSKQGTWTATAGGPGFRPATVIDNGPGNTYLKRWLNGNAYTTLLNTDGVMAVYKAVQRDGEVVVVATGDYASPVQCARDEQGTLERPIKYRKGPRDGVFGIAGTYVEDANRTTTLQENVYRQWSGTSVTNGTWSQPQTRIKLTETGLMVPPDYTQTDTWTSRDTVPPWFEIDQRYNCPVPAISTQAYCSGQQSGGMAVVQYYRPNNPPYDTNGCSTGGYCHHETFAECVERTGGSYQYGQYVGPSYGCCDVYYPGDYPRCKAEDPFAP